MFTIAESAEIPAHPAIIRPVVPSNSDLVAVTAIMAHYVEHTVATFNEIPPTTDDWAQRHSELIAHGLPFLVAETDGEVLGFAYVAPWRSKSAYRYTVENTVYLAPGATGRGVGTALLAELVDRSAAAGCRQMIAVIADTGSAASVRLHERLGFVDAGRLQAVGFKHGRWIDTRLMQRDLTASP
ncbi:GNAT family N-acetyltransferase [Promicromonospora panici]|uniref:GNAT family N-acetyltransferase n=1 Tax=Promicromonospora panici TaxID=2219658 RepID=UPI001F5E2B11|nr:GNAT family N-acetyltransferase [Promicromonospora panici]